ncbi:hypothetical protein [Nostoc sp. NMS9]|uniref:hypothetical protein n=1 Tax=Nostoc sp. NMS9 TaxID=2815393 RepID=UPI0025D02D24|nr:hypothetical protein [Nostoc sp. NMS9]MBN3941326.1 hypothetical protein [Nostoc sp. NMS9]
MLDHDFLAMALTCKFAVWDIADLGDRTYLNLVSSYLCHDTCDQFLALLQSWRCLRWSLSGW